MHDGAADADDDVPFSEANRGNEGIIKPAYDKQSVIYDSLLVELARAEKIATGAGAGYGGADPIYKGSKIKWKRFAGSLRARVAMRISNVNPARAATELNALVADSAMFLSNAILNFKRL